MGFTAPDRNFERQENALVRHNRFILVNTVLLPLLARRLQFCPIAMGRYQAIRLKGRIPPTQKAAKCQGAGVPVLNGIDKAAGRGSTLCRHSDADFCILAAERPVLAAIHRNTLFRCDGAKAGYHHSTFAGPIDLSCTNRSLLEQYASKGGDDQPLFNSACPSWQIR